MRLGLKGPTGVLGVPSSPLCSRSPQRPSALPKASPSRVWGSRGFSELGAGAEEQWLRLDLTSRMLSRGYNLPPTQEKPSPFLSHTSGVRQCSSETGVPSHTPTTHLDCPRQTGDPACSAPPTHPPPPAPEPGVSLRTSQTMQPEHFWSRKLFKQQENKRELAGINVPRVARLRVKQIFLSGAM